MVMENRPDDIPEWAWKAAVVADHDFVSYGFEGADNLIEALARTILRQRMRTYDEAAYRLEARGEQFAASGSVTGRTMQRIFSEEAVYFREAVNEL